MAKLIEDKLIQNKKPIRIMLPEELYDSYAADAASIGLSIGNWAKLAMSAYHAKWKTPDEMRKKKGGKKASVAKKWCIRCNLPAAECLMPDKHEAWNEWEEL